MAIMIAMNNSSTPKEENCSVRISEKVESHVNEQGNDDQYY